MPQFMTVERTGRRQRHYIDGRLVSRAAYWDAVDACDRLDTFQTVITRHRDGSETVRQYCCGRLNQPVFAQ